MSGPPVGQILAELRARDVHLEVDGDRIHVDAPKGAITAEELAVLRSRKTELRSRLEEEARLASMSFEQYGRTHLAVELAVPWMKEHMWLVPKAAHVNQLVGRGVDRGCVWTAADLIDLYTIDSLQERDRRAIALLKAHFGIKILSTEDCSDTDEKRERRCRSCRGTRYWRSIHGVTVCGRCHPPASPKLVAEWIEDADA